MSGGTDWAVGDLCRVVGADGPMPALQGDARFSRRLIYRVERVVWVHGDCGLVIEGQYSLHPTRGFLASNFRKIRPDTHEPCEEEFATLLKHKSAPVVSRKSSPVDGEQVA